MAISMTGFGRGEFKNENYEFVVECRTINHKYSDINIRMPRRISFLEEKVRNLIKEYVKRGRADVFVRMEVSGSEDVELKLDENLASQYVEILKRIRDKFDLKDDISAINIAKFPDVVRTEEKEEDEEFIWSMLKEAVEESMKKLTEMRREEGMKLESDVKMRSNLLEEYIIKIEGYADRVVLENKNKLTARIKEFIDNPEAIDENRIAMEAAIYADKSNITEEIVRFKSHIGQLRKTIESNESIGRKVDFLIQEMNRETNTIGSKSSDLDITDTVVEIKSELEKIREQIQNIE
ncbi:YicC family protein [Peptacetobacter hominis]|uniref:YicC family protein n=1 Tax=Peptacetobacter hominis TaxID=2743610 RepID=A0A544QUT2_9FIRM|nr:YicC/YloC family endoribonuclease [Peptacetobacter hominis]TQQ84437.1 YicC family protein [Peptacetobacter hominis]